jgi:hypothetical protein
MKKSELKQIIKEEISKTLNESPNIDMINRSLNILDKAADMAIKNPTGDIIELSNIIKKHITFIRKFIKNN